MRDRKLREHLLHSQFDSNAKSEAQASEISTVRFVRRARIFEILKSLENGERVGTIIARLAMRLGDVWVTLVKTSNVEYF